MLENHSLTTSFLKSLNNLHNIFPNKEVFINLIIFFFIIILFSCKKDEINIPISVKSSSLKLLGDSIYFYGEVNNVLDEVIVEHGFVVGLDSLPKFTNSIQKIISSTQIENQFYASAFNQFDNDAIYYLRAYIKTNTNSLLYGNSLSFNGRGKGAVAIEKFFPTQGKNGDFIKIYGSNFTNNIRVLFGDHEAEIESINLERIIVKVPNYNLAGPAKITIIKNSNTTVAANEFLLLGPQIKDFNPSLGNKEFQRIIITGDNFSEFSWRNKVRIGNYPAKIISSSKNQIEVIVNATDIQPGFYNLYVTTEDITCTSNQKFEITNPWMQIKVKFGEGLVYSASFIIEDKIYFCTGSSNRFNSQVWEYNLINDSWIRKKDFPGRPREGAVGFSINSKGYIGLGYSIDKKNDDFWEYNPDLDQWSQKANVPGGPRGEAIGFSYQGQGYIGLGYTNNRSIDFYRFDPESNSWTQLSDFTPNTIVGKSFILYNDKLYVFGQNESHITYSEIWSYNFKEDSWNFIDYLNKEIKTNYPTAFYNNERCFLLSEEFNDFDENYLKLHEFNPEKNQVVKGLPIIPTENHTFLRLGFNYIINQNLYLGIGTDIWKLNINE